MQITTLMRSRSAGILLIVAAVSTSGCKLFEKGESPTSPTPPATGPPAAGAAVHYTALGASDTNGVGGTVVCAPFETTCPNGTGYVYVLTRMLQGSRTVTLSNRGVLGAVLSPAIEQIARDYGRNPTGNFVDQQVPFVPRETTMLTVFGGGNDVNSLTEAIERGAGASNVKDYIDGQVRAYGADYDRLIRGVRDRAPAAFILVLNTPNMAALPYASGYAESRRRIMQHMSIGFAREANRQAAQGIVVLDLMCDAQVYDRARFSSDGFHPNDAGYLYLAQRLAAIVNGGSSTAATSCAQMTVVPPL